MAQAVTVTINLRKVFMKKLSIVVAIAAALLMAGCASAARTTETFSAGVVNIQGTRGNEIPAILTIPQGSGPHPVVLIAHGHGGSKTENGGFDLLAA